MVSEKQNQQAEFCRAISLYSAAATQSDEVKQYLTSDSKLYKQAEPYRWLEQLTFRDLCHEDYQYEFRENYLDAPLVHFDDDGVWLHKGLEYVLFYHLVKTFRSSIRQLLDTLDAELEKGTIVFKNDGYEITTFVFKHQIVPLLTQTVHDFQFVRYLFEHIARFIYQATDFVMIEKKNIAFVLDYTRRFTFEKLDQLNSTQPAPCNPQN